jgi:hypothetical protein
MTARGSLRNKELRTLAYFSIRPVSKLNTATEYSELQYIECIYQNGLHVPFNARINIDQQQGQQILIIIDLLQ